MITEKDQLQIDGDVHSYWGKFLSSLSYRYLHQWRSVAKQHNIDQLLTFPPTICVVLATVRTRRELDECSVLQRELIWALRLIIINCPYYRKINSDFSSVCGEAREDIPNFPDP